jgi:peptidoglycan/xylan/chitin deacetylase (PgdA/CDA1 family)
MKNRNIVFLMYHELGLPGRPPCDPEPGYVRYVVDASNFAVQMTWLKTAGWRGLSVSEALAFPETPSVAITFDDGCETDLSTAAPLLKDLGFSATFYITVDFLGRKGFLTRPRVRELSDRGFEIGSHSLTHPHLPDLSDRALESEIRDSKARMEEVCGKPVLHFSCPGGRYDSRVLTAARQAGFKSVATSDIHPNSPVTDRFRLGRVVVMRGTGLRQFQQICARKTLAKLSVYQSVRGAAKHILGNSAYERIRSATLKASTGH